MRQGGLDSKATDGVATAESGAGGGVRPEYGMEQEGADVWVPAVSKRKERRA